MTADKTKYTLAFAKKMQEAIDEICLLPSEISRPISEPVLPSSLFVGTRGYIEKIVYQINHSYSATCYDACAVMIRRLVEILIIEAFEHHGKSSKIQNSDKIFFYLQDLINIALSESWSLGRNTQAGLKKLKTIGDQSAHGRRYNAKKSYIDDVIIDLRTVSEEFLYLSGLRK
jgi:Domain of unknown function (DUF4145)